MCISTWQASCPTYPENAEDIATLVDVERLAIQDFIGTAPWEHRPLVQVLVGEVVERLGEPDGIIAIDPSSFPKRGRHGWVKRQWCSHRNGERLGFKTLIQPAKDNIKDHLAELGRLIRAGQNWPQAVLIHKLNPKIRGWANYYRTWVCQATFGRLDRLTWVKFRSWARRRHPKKAPDG